MPNDPNTSLYRMPKMKKIATWLRRTCLFCLLSIERPVTYDEPLFIAGIEFQMALGKLRWHQTEQGDFICPRCLAKGLHHASVDTIPRSDTGGGDPPQLGTPSGPGGTPSLPSLEAPIAEASDGDQ